MSENSLKVQEGFRKLLPVFSGYIGRELCQYCGNDYWWKYVLETLSDQVREHPGELPKTGTYAELIDSLDMANCLRLFDRSWNDIFRKKLSIDYRTWCKELMGVRNKLAHIGSGDFDENFTWRALDTMSLVCSAFDDLVAEEIREIQRELRYGNQQSKAETTVEESTTSKSTGVINKSFSNLPSWRSIIEPHPDVAQGRYKHAEFAADLAQVARGEGAIEYRDPVEFFNRTYVTEGMAGLLTQAVKRVSGQDGEPVIQLKTAFGGGKTHSMLALYHMLRAKVSIEKIPSVKPIIEKVGLPTLPKANVAVLVGTSLDPAKSRRPQNLPGITINTLWGEMAAQLCESAGNLSLYDYVKEADKKGISPGSEALKNLFDACSPCLILMDELVAYAKKLYGVDNLPAGSFDNFITFIQEITEAARASKNSLVVASIPQSDIEVGGDAGKIALESIEHTFGRMESIWKPVAPNEGFEVVRRRLFLDCKDTAARDQVCAAFSQFYSENKADFPIDASEVSYRERMISCYPIHPEVFDRLYEDWSTLERFQRTRGVLRLMAAVIHELWMGCDANAMIMPGSIPLDVQNVSYELTRHLGDDNWNAIIDSEVDGKNSAPYKLEKANQRFGGKLTARRVTRTIFLGSAPTDRGQSIRGLEIKKVHLGAILPEENIAEFNDALNSLQSTLSYLYTNSAGDRFWYDTRPTLRKTVEERATQISDSDVEYEIKHRLEKTIKKEALFDKPHICPSSSLDIPDDQNVRLVILSPKDTFKCSQENEAIKIAEEYLNSRGTSPRIYRNMLAFVAPDHSNMSSLKDGVKLFLAWESISNDSEILNLDVAQTKETQSRIKKWDETVNSRLLETYCWLLVPSIDRELNIKEIQWNSINIRGGNQSIVQKASDKLAQNEELITKWAPALLKMELDNLLWKENDYISIKTLWDNLTTYCYLPRLMEFSVLEKTIIDGVNSDEFFAYAAAIDNGRYVDLKYKKEISYIDKSGYLVKLDPARKQLLEEAESKPTVTDKTGSVNSGTGFGNGTSTQPASETESPNQSENVSKTSQFFMTAKLDTTRINRDVQNLVQEVISHLSELDDCNVEITLEVSAHSDNGFDVPTIRTVSENCKTLKVDNFGFETE